MTRTVRVPPRPPGADASPTSCSSVPPRRVRRRSTPPSRSTPSCSSAPPRSRSTTCAATPRHRRTEDPATPTATGSGSGSGSATSTCSARPATTSRPVRARRSTSTTGTRGDGSPTDLPSAKLVAVLRDPVDRAYSNWMHLWADGLEPCGDVVRACAKEAARVEDGWAPFWHYRGLGMYGRQLADLFEHFPREQVLVLRYRQLVDEPHRTLNKVCRFLGVSEDVVTSIPAGNSRPFVHPSVRTKLLGPLVRAGASAGQFLPPAAWRQLSRPLVAQLHQRGHPARPALSEEQRDAPPRTVPRGPRAARGGHRTRLHRLARAPRRRLVPHPVAARVDRLRPRIVAEDQSPRLVIRSCAPSGRAASK